METVLTPVAIVVAMTRSGVIGGGGKIPWDLPADRQLFGRLTTGNTVIMGRATYLSLPGTLPHRNNLVVSRSSCQLPGVTVCATFAEALSTANRLGRPIFVIGGVDIYRQALAVADTLHVSWVEGDYPGDRCFPTGDLSAWTPVSSTTYPGFQHVIYLRRSATASPSRFTPA